MQITTKTRPSLAPSFLFILLGLILGIFSYQPAVTSAASPLALYSWGYNNYGQLGNGHNSDTNLPLRGILPAGVSRFTAIDTGLNHTLALGDNGKLYVWGDNTDEQFGNGTNVSSNVPVEVSVPVGATRYTVFAGGYRHSIGLADNGKLYAWGNNSAGELGNGTNTNSNLPVEVILPAGVNTFTAIAAGSSHSLGLGDNGKLYAWGNNGVGELGNNSNTDSNVPVEVVLPAGVNGFTTMATFSGHNLAFGDNGKLYAWGNNILGQLGDGTNVIERDSPVEVVLPVGVNRFTSFSVGHLHSLAIGDNGKLYSWGYNMFGQLGNGTNDDSKVPLEVSLPGGVTGFTKVSGGLAFTLALANNGRLYAWGNSLYGQLGNGTNDQTTVPVPVSLPQGSSIDAFSAGGYHGLALISLDNPTSTSPADLVASLRVTPDREFGLIVPGDNLLTYTLSLKNIGPGQAGFVYAQLPIDPSLEVAFATIDHPDTWVEKIVTGTANPYLQVRYPALDTNTSISLKVAFRTKAGSAAGAVIATRFSVFWDDETGSGKSSQSNAVRLTLTDGSVNRDDTGGEVQLFTLEPGNGTVSVAADFYIPNEPVDVWYTNSANQSVSLGRFTADNSGHLIVEVSLQDFNIGETYIIAGRGGRSEVTGAGAVTKVGTSASSLGGKATFKALSGSQVDFHAYLPAWQNQLNTK